MSDALSFSHFRQLRAIERKHKPFEEFINELEKVELLDEMVKFQQEKLKKETLSLEQLVQGRIIYRALEKVAESRELQILTRAYLRHLEYELEQFVS